MSYLSVNSRREPLRAGLSRPPARSRCGRERVAAIGVLDTALNWLNFPCKADSHFASESFRVPFARPWLIGCLACQHFGGNAMHALLATGEKRGGKRRRKSKREKKARRLDLRCCQAVFRSHRDSARSRETIFVCIYGCPYVYLCLCA